MEIAIELNANRQKGNQEDSLRGLPVLLKDNIDTHYQMPTIVSSRLLARVDPDDKLIF